MECVKPKIVVEGYELLYEDALAHQTEGIPTDEVLEVQAFLQNCRGIITRAASVAQMLKAEWTLLSPHENIWVAIGHRVGGGGTASAEYRLRIISEGMIFLDRKGNRIGQNSVGESGGAEDRTYEPIGRLEWTLEPRRS